MGRRTAPKARSAEGAERFLTLWRRLCKWEGARRRAPKALDDSARSGTSSRWQQTTTPQERAAAAVPALRRGADNEKLCCCHDDVSDNERASGNGSIAVAGTQVASAPRVSRAVFLSHRSSLRRTAAGEGAKSAVRRRSDVLLGACRRRRRRGGVQLYQLWAAWGATGQLSGIWLGLWVSASGGAALSASIFISSKKLWETM